MKTRGNLFSRLIHFSSDSGVTRLVRTQKPDIEPWKKTRSTRPPIEEGSGARESGEFRALYGASRIEPALRRRLGKYAKISWMPESVKDALEYAAALALLKTFGWMPRFVAYSAAEIVALLGYRFAKRQREAGFKICAWPCPRSATRNA